MKNRLSSIYKNPTSHFLLLAIICTSVASGLYSGIFNNYLHDVLAIGKFERGIIEFPREIPGLILIALIALFYKVRDTRIFTIAIIFSIIGITCISIYGENYWMAIGMIMIASCGDHIVMPIRDSIGIQMANTGKEGRAMGILASAGNIGQVIGYYLVPLLILAFPFLLPDKGSFTHYQAVFRIVVFFLLVAFIFSFRIKTGESHIRRERFYFNRKYYKYYGLEMFFGARKQVFLTFAPYVLIINYGIKAEILSLLYGIAATLNIIVGPMIGRLIDRTGYRKIIIYEATVLMILCFLYGFVQHLFPNSTAFYIVCGVFILDSVLFTAGMARSLYARSISDSQAEFTATLSSGVSINHLIGIIIAISGGILWERLGVELLFSISGFFGLCYLFFAFGLPNINKLSSISNSKEK